MRRLQRIDRSDLKAHVQADGNEAAGATTFGATGAEKRYIQFQGSGLGAP